jgi:RNA polymerase sigma-70 factor (ECF subfamily)
MAGVVRSPEGLPGEEVSIEGSIIAPSLAAGRRKRELAVNQPDRPRDIDVTSAALSAFTDEVLACRARSGATDCFEELVRRYQVPLLRFLQRKSPQRHEAEDLLQESFLRAYQSLARYREEWPFRTWLFTLSYRLSISAARKKRPVAEGTGGYAFAIDRTGSPADHAERGDSRRHLWEVARRTLDDEQFSALWLHYGESMPAKEISEVLDRSGVWVRTSLYRARRKLAKVLEPLAHTGSPDSAAIRGES